MYFVNFLFADLLSYICVLHRYISIYCVFPIMSTTAATVHRRGHLRSRVTLLFDRRNTYATLPPAERNALNAKLSSHLVKLQELDSEIQTSKWSGEENLDGLNEELDSCEEYADRIRLCMAELNNEVPPVPTHDQARPVRTVNAFDAARSLLKSPTAPLPKYSGQESEDLTRFLSQFQETISKFNYPNYDKFLLLKQQLSGRALILVESLEVNRQTYDEAVELLKAALDSPVTKKFNVIKQLTELSLKSYADPFEYISKYRKLSEIIEMLNVNRDGFLQYFFWTGLTDNFRDEYVQITNETKPQLNTLVNQFFNVCERRSQKETASSYHSEGKSVALASSVIVSGKSEKSKFKPCSLCSKDTGKDSDHPIQRCRVYKTADEKVSKLKEYGGCLKCTTLGHVQAKCSFKLFSRCSLCSRWHFSFLCTEKSSGDKSGTKNRSEKKNTVNLSNSSNSSVSTANMISVSNSSVSSSRAVIPTFVCAIGGRKLRGLKDIGCQSNFVTASAVKNCAYNVLQDSVDLKVTGFNTSCIYRARVLEIAVEFGENVRKIPVIEIPSINIALNLPGLSEVAREFVARGYTLADSNLISNDSISNLDLVLGTKSAHCLRASEIAFGHYEDSVYGQSDIGVLLMGDVDTMRRNLSFLPTLKSLNSSSFTASTGIQSIVENKRVKTSESSLNFGIFENDHISLPSAPVEFVTSANFLVLNGDDQVDRLELDRATEEVLEKTYIQNLDVHADDDPDISSEENCLLMRWALDNSTHDSDGRICLPLLWNPRVKHLLGFNKRLSEAILASNLSKYKDGDTLQLLDEVFKKQANTGIIERIDDIDSYISEHQNCSFLAHMPVFRPDSESTKIRVVFLSNLAEKNRNNYVSHNQAIHAGPPLNQRISAASIQLRFGKFLLTYDLVKAFNQISMSESDSNKLLFLWFRDPANGDFSLIGYRCVRLPFGIRCAPTLLMLTLFKLLVLDTDHDSDSMRNLKKLMYQLLYVDNGAVCVDSERELKQTYEMLQPIFSKYCFEIQQLHTNCAQLQDHLDAQDGEVLPAEVKLLGIVWNRSEDVIYPRPIALSIEANTKRKILQSIASQFDVHNVNAPLLNRSRLFLHRLQCNQSLGWDDELSADTMNEWRNIVRQVNSSPVLKIRRNVGSRSDSYRLIAYTDASSEIYGAVVYIYNENTKETSFLLAKNRIVGVKLQRKSIPALELQGVLLGVNCLMEMYTDLAGPTCVSPVNISGLHLYTDSLVSLQWVTSAAHKFDKMNKRSVFVMNRLTDIQRLCEIHSVVFDFVPGAQNPADYVTRRISYKCLIKSNYLTGIVPLEELSPFRLVVPSVDSQPSYAAVDSAFVAVQEDVLHHVVPLDRYEHYRKLVRVTSCVLSFLNKLKGVSSSECVNAAKLLIISTEQKICFPEVYNYFHSKTVSMIPNLITQLNLFIDSDGIIRVKSKFRTPDSQGNISNYPILLPKCSKLTELIVRDIHESTAHSGCYAVLRELRKLFYIPCHFSVVKKILRCCVHCKRLNARPYKLNQGMYREFRASPPSVVFSHLYMDYLGPFYTRRGDEKSKVWLLCLTCMWSRAVNLKVCVDQTVEEFLRSFQLHCFQYGVPALCVSDLGTQLTAGGRIITDFLDDARVYKYLDDHGVRRTEFNNYFKGCSKLGGMVEVIVKYVKKLVFGSIKKNVLSLREFEFLIENIVHLTNRRPVALKDSLRDSDVDVPESISPEKLIHGRDLISVNIIPGLQPRPDDEDFTPEPVSKVDDAYEKLRRVRQNLTTLYNAEFTAALVSQAVDKKSRYKPITRDRDVAVGDVVLIIEEMSKPQNYPMGRIAKIYTNYDGEVTNADVKKGRTGEITKRHVTSLIPLLHSDVTLVKESTPHTAAERAVREQPSRRAAVKCRELCKNMQ